MAGPGHPRRQTARTRASGAAVTLRKTKGGQGRTDVIELRALNRTLSPTVVPFHLADRRAPYVRPSVPILLPCRRTSEPETKWDYGDGLTVAGTGGWREVVGQVTLTKRRNRWSCIMFNSCALGSLFVRYVPATLFDTFRRFQHRSLPHRRVIRKVAKLSEYCRSFRVARARLTIDR